MLRNTIYESIKYGNVMKIIVLGKWEPYTIYFLVQLGTLKSRLLFWQIAYLLTKELIKYALIVNCFIKETTKGEHGKLLELIESCANKC